MKLVHDCPEARWLPTRYDLALFRLLAALRFRGRGAPSGRKTIHAIDRHQSTSEAFTLAVLFWTVVSIYMAYALSAAVPLAAALVVGAFLAPLVIQFPMYVTGVVARNRVRLNSFVMLGLIMAASAYYATVQAWVRWPARVFLALVAANIVAAPVAWLLRGWFAEMESRCAG